MARWTPGGHDSLVPPGFNPKAPIPKSLSYVERHPTRYRWRRHVKPLIRKVYREMGGPDEIHINTYLDHPEGLHRTLTSFDVWGPAGRGDPISFAKGERVRKIVFNDPGLLSSSGRYGNVKYAAGLTTMSPIPLGTTSSSFMRTICISPSCAPNEKVR
jgi:hypothetical protein